jgi:hypothetical protein
MTYRPRRGPVATTPPADRCSFFETPLRGGRLTPTEFAFDATADGGGDAGDILVSRRGRRMEDRLSARGRGREAINAVQEQGVEVRAGAERRVETLNDRHRSRLERAADAESPRPPPQPRRNGGDVLA